MVRTLAAVLRRRLTYRLLLARPSRGTPRRTACVHAALDWLLRAHAAVHEQGFSGQYSLAHGWGAAYPETSGYLLPTLLLCRTLGHRREELERAIAATGRWLLEIQHPDGAFDAPATGERMAFDTGQVLFGLLALADGGADPRFLEAARRAGDWLLAVQEPDGPWVRAAYRGIPHTYYARVAWALVHLARRTGADRFREAALRQLRWVQRQQDRSGWFAHCSFYPDDRPVLHVIAYTVRGLWESALLLGDAALEAGAVQAADALLRLEAGRGFLESRFGPGWQPRDDSICVTGLCQTCIIWLRMARRYGRDDLRRAGERCLEFVSRRQFSTGAHAEVDGALPGSFPLWGGYFPWAIPNWGVKFFIDAHLVAEGRVDDESCPG